MSSMQHANSDSSAARKKPPLPPWLIILLWISLSTAVIFVNREILVGKGGFPYPITLTTLHLLFQTVATRILHRTTNLIAGDPSEYAPLPTSDKPDSDEETAQTTRQAKDASVHIDWETWKRKIVPPAALFSISLMLSNWAYLWLSTAYIHVLKAFSPVAVLICAFIFGTKTFSVQLSVIVVVISAGTCIASWGEASFSLIGFLIQASAIAVEAVRVTLIQILLGGENMSPLRTLFHFAPICLGINAVLIIPLEGFKALAAIPDLGFFVIAINCLLTFLLTVSTIYMIGLGSIVLSLTKVTKDILIVLGSTLVLGESMSLLQIGGYTIATAGLIYYKMNM